MLLQVQNICRANLYIWQSLVPNGQPLSILLSILLCISRFYWGHMSLFDDDVSGSVFVLLEVREIFADARLGSETPRVRPHVCFKEVPHAYSLEVHLRGRWMRY